MKHELKTVNPYFTEVWSGKKTFECRKNDRDFKEGDSLVLQEYKPSKDSFSGRTIIAEVLYVLSDFEGLREGYVIMAIEIKGYGEFDNGI